MFIQDFVYPFFPQSENESFVHRNKELVYLIPLSAGPKQNGVWVTSLFFRFIDPLILFSAGKGTEKVCTIRGD